MTMKADQLMQLGVPAAVAVALGYIEYAGDPTNNVTPNHIGQWCFDTSNADWYIASTAAAAGWKISAT